MDKGQYAEQVVLLKDRLYRTAYLYLGSETDALEALDEAVYKGLKACGSLRQPEYFATWLTRILINTCLAELRRKKRMTPMDEMPDLPQDAYDALPLKQAIAVLPEPLRAVVVLRFFIGMTLEDTAQVLRVTRATVSARQKKALGLLKLDLEDVSHGPQAGV